MRDGSSEVSGTIAVHSDTAHGTTMQTLALPIFDWFCEGVTGNRSATNESGVMRRVPHKTLFNLPLYRCLTSMGTARPRGCNGSWWSDSFSSPERIIVEGFLSSPGSVSLQLNGVPQDSEYTTGHFHLTTGHGNSSGYWRISTNSEIATVSDRCGDFGPMSIEPYDSTVTKAGKSDE